MVWKIQVDEVPVQRTSQDWDVDSSKLLRIAMMNT
jgi:hypothetical protein